MLLSKLNCTLSCWVPQQATNASTEARPSIQRTKLPYSSQSAVWESLQCDLNCAITFQPCPDSWILIQRSAVFQHLHSATLLFSEFHSLAWYSSLGLATQICPEISHFNRSTVKSFNSADQSPFSSRTWLSWLPTNNDCSHRSKQPLNTLVCPTPFAVGRSVISLPQRWASDLQLFI